MKLNMSVPKLSLGGSGISLTGTTENNGDETLEKYGARGFLMLEQGLQAHMAYLMQEFLRADRGEYPSEVKRTKYCTPYSIVIVFQTVLHKMLFLRDSGWLSYTTKYLCGEEIANYQGIEMPIPSFGLLTTASSLKLSGQTGVRLDGSSSLDIELDIGDEDDLIGLDDEEDETTEEESEKLRDFRRATVNEAMVKEMNLDGRYILCLAFQKQEYLDQFIDGMEWRGLGGPYYCGEEIAHRMGIQIAAPIPAMPNWGKKKALADLSQNDGVA